MATRYSRIGKELIPYEVPDETPEPAKPKRGRKPKTEEPPVPVEIVDIADPE